MCVLPPLPPIAPVLPWDAPGVWAVWLATVGFFGLLFWAGRVNRSYGRDPHSRAEWVLNWTGVALLLAGFGLILIVYFPADNALIRWRYIASGLRECDRDVWLPVWSQQSHALTTLLMATIVLEAIAFALVFGVSGVLASRRQRRERMAGTGGRVPVSPHPPQRPDATEDMSGDER